MLDGVFAFVLYDTRTKTYMAARDAIGVNPLYIGRGSDGTYAAVYHSASILHVSAVTGTERERLDLSSLMMFHLFFSSSSLAVAVMHRRRLDIVRDEGAERGLRGVRDLPSGPPLLQRRRRAPAVVQAAVVRRERPGDAVPATPPQRGLREGAKL